MLDQVAFIADIHSNLPALEAVLDEIQAQGIFEIYCLGDIIGYYTFPNEVIHLCKQKCEMVVLGNHDAAALGNEYEYNKMNKYAKEAMNLTRELITSSNLNWLKRLEKQHTLSVNEKQIHLVHGHPGKPFSYSIAHSEIGWEAIMESAKDLSGTGVVVVGHTHVPTVRRTDNFLFLNPGSVGQPRNGQPGAQFAIFDTDTGEVTLEHIEYDIEQTMAAAREHGLSDYLAKRLTKGR